jgi:hypothetical protein
MQSVVAYRGRPSLVMLLLDHGVLLDGLPLGNALEDHLDRGREAWLVKDKR